MKWTSSNHCKSRVHCVACRTDAAWRESLQRAGLVESAEFGCVYGVTPGNAKAVQDEALAKLPKPPLAQSITENKIKIEEEGRIAWKALHRAGYSNMISDNWLETWEALIPKYNCQCLNEWKKIRTAIPFRPEDQFAWAWEVHQAVNKKLGKAGLSIEEAKAIFDPEH
jgi:hypothetical protein